MCSDWCSLETAVEVFESIKVFLEIDGFVITVRLNLSTASSQITRTIGLDVLLFGITLSL
jgi:hypothetical protein